PAVVRAAQRDALARHELWDRLSGVARPLLGTRVLQRHQRPLRLAADSLYYLLTSALGSPTLGEEYCDILQVDPSTVPPSPARRVALIACSVLSPYAFEALLLACAPVPSGPLASLRHRLFPTWLITLVSQRASGVRWVVKDLLASFHLAVFYLFGKYHSIAKRITGIRYIATSQPAEGEPETSGYEALGLMLLARLGIQLYSVMHKTDDESDSTSPPKESVDLDTPADELYDQNSVE
ncbi:peroxisome biogenesis factor 10, partial [Cladochytrium tenue]